MNLLQQHAGLYTDYYELTMAQGYFLSGKHLQKASFDYYYRTNPYKGGYLVFAGLNDFLQTLKNFKYSSEDLNYLASTGLHPEFIEYLRKFEFTGTIHSVREGEIVFPNTPIMRVEGNLVESQIIETLLLNFINFQSLIATKAFRIKLIAGDRPFSDFGLRRAQGLGSIQATRATIIGGATSTSNVYAAKQYNVPAVGTIAHAWIQSFGDELEAFRTYASHNPDNTVLLVDTYDTLKSGIPNAIVVAKELEAKGYQLKGIRLDSGDLAYLSKRARKMLEAEGLGYVKIMASNQLNEHVLKSLNEQGAQLDAFGIGTELVTAKPDAALDGVYKLAECDGEPRMKLSENIEKLTLPGTKKLVRYYDRAGEFFRDGVLLKDEATEEVATLYHPHYPHKWTDVSGLKTEELTQIVYENGEIINPITSLTEIHDYLMKRSEQLSFESKRFINPHIYKVGISKGLQTLKNDLLHQIKPSPCK
ncbi:nicotinate phosphoribosyltransferase [Prolixibacteraceae bacterium JC049]|nr:nicotinate phosphoribosyltransferase [Prolixibacteraceae bacterium JC049]